LDCRVVEFINFIKRYVEYGLGVVMVRLTKIPSSMATEIHDLYWNKEYTQEDIANFLRTNKGINVCRETVKEFMRRHGIPTRSRSEQGKLRYRIKGIKMIDEIRNRRINIPKDVICDMYHSRKMSIREIAWRLRCSPCTIGKRLREYGVKTRPNRQRRNCARAHDAVIEKHGKSLKHRFKKVINLTFNSSVGYCPDFIVVDNDGNVYAYEVEGGGLVKKRLNEKVEKAKKAGFDGVIIYRYTKLKDPERVIKFNGGDDFALS